MLEYPEPVSNAVKDFKRAKKQVLDGLIGMGSYHTPGGKQETTFLREEAVYLFLQYSNKPRAELIQLAIAKILNFFRQLTEKKFESNFNETKPGMITISVEAYIELIILITSRFLKRC